MSSCPACVANIDARTQDGNTKAGSTRAAAIPEKVLFSAEDGTHKVSHEGIVHATVGGHVTLHQLLKLLCTATGPMHNSPQCSQHHCTGSIIASPSTAST